MISRQKKSYPPKTPTVCAEALSELTRQSFVSIFCALFFSASQHCIGVHGTGGGPLKQSFRAFRHDRGSPSVLELARSRSWGIVPHRKIAHDGQGSTPARPLMSLRSTPSRVPQPKREVSEEGTEKQRERVIPEKSGARLGANVPATTGLPFAWGLMGDTRTISVNLKLVIGTEKWQQQVVWHRVLSGLAEPKERQLPWGKALATPAETDDGVGLNCSIAEFRSLCCQASLYG
ncbi:hypothetical protein B0I37DRAFT_205114 [Chaetomium sp. MPI-CAGE-AT-0009]|nr:hypothetical protein B0I37DRAFT_205114 [Chaetomium sp. MPI-CAGE-AT-0009]